MFPFDFTKLYVQLEENFLFSNFQMPKESNLYINDHFPYRLDYSWFFHNNEKYFVIFNNFEQQEKELKDLPDYKNNRLIYDLLGYLEDEYNREYKENFILRLELMTELQYISDIPLIPTLCSLLETDKNHILVC